jgi:hypothetical protein
MNEQELEQEILDYIKNLYKADFIGKIEVTKNPYSLLLGIPSYMHPTLLSGDFSDDTTFLEYIYKELKTRNYMRVYFYKVTRTNKPHEK